MYQEYRVRFNLRNLPMGLPDMLNRSGDVASFVGAYQYVDAVRFASDPAASLAVGRNVWQGFFAFRPDLPPPAPQGMVVEGQSPAGATTVPNPIFATSPIPAGSCLVTGVLQPPLLVDDALRAAAVQFVARPAQRDVLPFHRNIEIAITAEAAAEAALRYKSNVQQHAKVVAAKRQRFDQRRVMRQLAATELNLLLVQLRRVRHRAAQRVRHERGHGAKRGHVRPHAPRGGQGLAQHVKQAEPLPRDGETRLPGLVCEVKRARFPGVLAEAPFRL